MGTGSPQNKSELTIDFVEKLLSEIVIAMAL
jgi:hypothetical protein